MSDLHCAATLLIACHGEAEHASAPEDSGGILTGKGREQSRALAVSLRARNVAMVYSSPMACAVQTAEIVAGELGVPVRVSDGLRDLSVGESAQQTVDRVRRELEGAADLHRGETVLVVTHAAVVGVALPRLASNVPTDVPDGRPLGGCDVVELAVDADGWVVRAQNPAAPAE